MQGKEDDERHRDRDEGRRREDTPIAAARAQQVAGDLHSLHLSFVSRRQEHLGNQQVVLGPEELEDCEGGQRGEAERQNDLYEDLEIDGLVDLGTLDDVARQADQVVAQQVDGERLSEGRMRESDAEEALPNAHCVVQLEHQNQRELQRHDQHRSRDRHLSLELVAYEWLGRYRLIV